MKDRDKTKALLIRELRDATEDLVILKAAHEDLQEVLDKVLGAYYHLRKQKHGRRPVLTFKRMVDHLIDVGRLQEAVDIVVAKDAAIASANYSEAAVLRDKERKLYEEVLGMDIVAPTKGEGAHGAAPAEQQ